VELARRPCGGIVRIFRRLSEPPVGRRWPLEGGSASLEARGGGVHDGIGALLAARAVASLEARGGGVHDGIGALLDGIGLCPLAPCSQGLCKVGARWNWLAARAGASSEFYEVSPSRREAAGGLWRVARPLWRPWAAGCTTE